MLRSFLRKIFHLYPGEGRRALPLFLLGFLWSFGSVSGMLLADAAFLYNLDAEQLPTSYFISSVIMMGASLFLVSRFHKQSSYSFFLSNLLFAIILYLSAGFAFSIYDDPPPDSFWLTFRVIAYVCQTSLLSSYWSFMDNYHTEATAKRLYALLNSSVFLGMLSAGALLSTNLISTQQYCFVIPAVLIFTILTLQQTYKHLNPVIVEQADHEAPPPHSIKCTFRAIFSSPYTFYFTLGALLIESINFITEFNYQSEFERYFGLDMDDIELPDENPLNHFLGTARAFISFANLIFGLFFYSRFIQRFSVHNAVLIYPFLFVILFTFWPENAVDSLFFPLLGFAIVEGVLYSINDNTFQIALGAVPTNYKGTIRLVIAAFFEPLALLLSSLTITFAGEDKYVAWTFSLASLLCACMVRKLYMRSKKQ